MNNINLTSLISDLKIGLIAYPILQVNKRREVIFLCINPLFVMLMEHSTLEAQKSHTPVSSNSGKHLHTKHQYHIQHTTYNTNTLCPQWHCR